MAATPNDLCELREPSAASGGYSEAEAQCARELKEAALAATHNDLCELRRRGAKRPERAGPGAFGPGSRSQPVEKPGYASGIRRVWVM